MRPDGSAGAPGLHDHVCWAFSTDDGFRAPAVGFLEDGRRLRQRLLYVAPGEREKLREDLAGLDDRDRLIETGGLLLAPLDEVYPGRRVGDRDAQLAGYAALTERAVADGYTGLRVAAQVTALAAEPGQCAGHTRWESVADHFMAARPLAALCGYDERVVGAEQLADLACVHPVSNCGHLAPFHLSAGDRALLLSGEVDAGAAGALGRLLDLAAEPGSDLTLDLGQLRSIDRAGLAALERHARERAARGGRLELRSAPAFVEPWGALAAP